MNQGDALVDFCTALLQDEKIIRQPNWRKIVIACQVGEDFMEMEGYSYNIQGECLMVSPSLSFCDEKLRTLHRIMKNENPKQKGWLACMIRISCTGKFGVDFEYNDPDRWRWTIDNYEDRMKEFSKVPV